MMNGQGTRRSRLAAAPRITFLLALLSIAGVLLCHFTMHAMSHTGLETMIATPAHAHSIGPAADTNVAVTVHGKATGGADESMPASGVMPMPQGHMGGVAGGLLTIGCIIALLAVALRMLLAQRPMIGRAIHLQALRILSVGTQRLPRPPSLVALSISRT